MNNKIIKIIVIIAVFILFIIGVMYLVDLNRMNRNEKVLFSTWGKKYTAPLNDENMDSDNVEPEANKQNNNIKTKIEDLPQDYSWIKAIQDKCIVSIHEFKMYNKDELDKFLDKVNKNEPYSIRTIRYTTEGDMMIMDINFEGNDVYTTCCDWTRDKFSSEQDRTYKRGKFSKLVIDENYGEDSATEIYLTNKLEGELDEVEVAYYSKNTKIINNYEFNYLLDVKSDNKKQTKKITEGDLSKKYNYNIYYCGIESSTIQIDNERIDLKQALEENKITMEQIIEQAEKDRKNDVIDSEMLKDGGTIIYYYDTYIITKKHTIDGDRDVYIGIPEMN